jgi:hypothetical protein
MTQMIFAGKFVQRLILRKVSAETAQDARDELLQAGWPSVGSVRSHDGVLERHRAGLRVDMVFDELESCSLRGVGEQRQTTA